MDYEVERDCYSADAGSGVRRVVQVAMAFSLERDRNSGCGASRLSWADHHQRRSDSFFRRAVDGVARDRRPENPSPIRATTQWTDALLPIAAGADLFVTECYEYERAVARAAAPSISAISSALSFYVAGTEDAFQPAWRCARRRWRR